MCGRFTLTITPEMFEDWLEVEDEADFPPRYNIAPTQPILTVLNDHGRRVSRLMRWGLVPGWVKDPSAFSLLINARIETVTEKPAFRDALRHGRCIVPASGYYEWQRVSDKARQPCFVTRTDGAPMALAALYSIWTGPNGEEVDTVATITMAARDELEPLHDRMPVTLADEAIADWLDVRGVRENEALALLAPPPAGTFRFHPVSSRVNSAEFDDAELTAPVAAMKPPKPAQLDLF